MDFALACLLSHKYVEMGHTGYLEPFEVRVKNDPREPGEIWSPTSFKADLKKVKEALGISEDENVWSRINEALKDNIGESIVIPTYKHID
ncbi:hypothetical protein [Halomonas sp. C22]|uniref:hypothetical protein n=1 Tax=Halomonas sp. C22 TaxID=2580567 RepID=UPI0011A6E14A|nr:MULTISPECIES: hypothetical protein [unclassified Halomonas]MDM7480644.1 hypothetical protein [Halomonas sp.]